MSLLTVIKNVAKSVSLGTPTTVQNLIDPDGDVGKLIQFSNLAGQEIARRVNWPDLKDEETFTGNGTSKKFTFTNSDCARLVEGNAVHISGTPVKGSISEGLFNRTTPIVGTPRYFILRNQSVEFYPFPSNLLDVTVNYQNSNWALKNGLRADCWDMDNDTAFVPEELIEEGIIWRWKRHIGGEFQDLQAEYEATLVSLAEDHTRLRSS